MKKIKGEIPRKNYQLEVVVNQDEEAALAVIRYLLQSDAIEQKWSKANKLPNKPKA